MLPATSTARRGWPATSSAVFNRQSVQRSLRCAQTLLKSVCARQADKHGVILYAGPEIARLVYPPQPVPHSLYLCDRRFHTEMLEEMIAPKDKVGFVVCDGQTATVASVCGRQRTIHGTIDSSAKSRSRRGGQSSHRFERLRDHAEHDYVKAVSELMLHVFITLNDRGDPVPCVTRVILAGPAGVKNLLFEYCQTLPHLPALLGGLITTTHVGLSGLAEAANRAGTAPTPSPHLVRFLSQMGDARVCYGPEHVCGALLAGAVDVLLLDDEAAAGLPLPARVRAARKTLVEWCTGIAEEQGTEVVAIQPHTAEGVRFVASFGGLGALLRWEYDPGDGAAAAEEEEEKQVEAEAGILAGDLQQSDVSEGAVNAPDAVVASPFAEVPQPAPTPAPVPTSARASTPEHWEDSPLLLPPGLTVPPALIAAAATTSAVSSSKLRASAAEFVPGRAWGVSL
eukprot:m.6289 g.6289  ORF g.6289 m.6289 type:complete len:454 (-) comp4744_c0_seq2:78-1439(-)